MNLAHLATYEELVACPVLEALAAGRDGSGAVTSANERVEEALRVSAQPLDELMERLRAARQCQIQVVEAFDPQRFNAPVTGLWGDRPHSAAWVATKTFQHTWEHGNTIMRVALYEPP